MSDKLSTCCQPDPPFDAGYRRQRGIYTSLLLLKFMPVTLPLKTSLYFISCAMLALVCDVDTAAYRVQNIAVLVVAKMDVALVRRASHCLCLSLHQLECCWASDASSVHLSSMDSESLMPLTLSVFSVPLTASPQFVASLSANTLNTSLLCVCVQTRQSRKCKKERNLCVLVLRVRSILLVNLRRKDVASPVPVVDLVHSFNANHSNTLSVNAEP